MPAIIGGSDAGYVTPAAEGCRIDRNGVWRAIQVHTAHELQFAAHMIRDGLEGYVPTYQASVRWSDRTKTVPRALFPGYVFAKFDCCERSTLVRIPQFVRILDVALPPAEIERIKTLQAQPSVEPAPFAELIGEEVIFGSGHALAGMHGRAVAVGRGYQVRVEIQMLGRAVKVTCDGFDLLPARPRTREEATGTRGNRAIPMPAVGA